MTTPSLRTLLVASLLTSACVFGVSIPARAGWIALDSGTTDGLSAVHFIDLDRGYAVGASGTGLKTTDAGATWQVMNMGVAANLNDVFFQGDTGVAVGDGGIVLRTTDAGSNWSSISSGVVDDLLSVSLSGSGGVSGGRSQTILYSSDTGASWEVSQEGLFGGGFGGAVMLSSDIAFVGGENSIFQPLAGKSTDGGVTWDFNAFYLDGNEGRISAIEFTDENIGHAASAVWDGRGAVSKTTNGGQTWTTTLFPDALTGIAFPISDASQIGYAVGAAGRISKTTDAGGSWEEQASGTAALLTDVHFLDFDNGFVVGDGGTILRTTDGGEDTASTDGSPNSSETALPTTLGYPNPFERTAHIRYQITTPGPMELSIFDVRGRRITTLVRTQQVAGTHVTQWDGTDGLGRVLESGVYSYRIVTGGTSESGRLLLLR